MARRAALLALALLVAQPTRACADEGGNLPIVHQRAQARRQRGLTLLGVGLGLAAVAVAGLIVVASSSGCGDDSDPVACAAPRLAAGGWIAAAGFGIGVPLLATGFAQRRIGSDDDSVAFDTLPPGFFIDRAERRIRRGRTLVIAGALISLVAAGIGAGALALAESDYHNPQLFEATSAMGAVAGIVGLGVLVSGATLLVMGRHDARLSW